MAIWFSATAFIVSALSFVAAGTQTWLTYQHNRLSVMPKLDWRVSYADAAGPRLDVLLVNAGLGPAKVSAIKLDVDNVILPLEDGRACTAIDALINADPVLAKGSDCFELDVQDWVFVKPGENLVLYSSGQQAGLDLSAVSIGVGARYCSLYDQCEDL